MASTQPIAVESFMTTLLNDLERWEEDQEQDGPHDAAEEKGRGRAPAGSSNHSRSNRIRVSLVADNAYVHPTMNTPSRPLPPKKSYSLPSLSRHSSRTRKSSPSEDCCLGAEQSKAALKLKLPRDTIPFNKPSILRKKSGHRSEIPKESIHESSTRKVASTQYKACAAAAAAAAATHRQSRWSSCTSSSPEQAMMGIKNGQLEESPLRIPRFPKRQESLERNFDGWSSSSSSCDLPSPVWEQDVNEQSKDDLPSGSRYPCPGTHRGTVKDLITQALNTIVGDPAMPNSVGGKSA